jgi:hypothetical protein
MADDAPVPPKRNRFDGLQPLDEQWLVRMSFGIRLRGRESSAIHAADIVGNDQAPPGQTAEKKWSSQIKRHCGDWRKAA